MRWLAAAAIVTALGGLVQAESPITGESRGPATFPQDAAFDLQAALNQWAVSPQHRGVSAAVILANGNEWVSTAGIEETGKSLEAEHLIWIASITKTMTGSVIMGLAEEGILGLDDPISRWLDEMKNIDPKITLRQLLNHTNGLANYTAHPRLGAIIEADPAHKFAAMELISYVGPKSFQRGKRTQYTNTSFVLLGMVAQAATDQSITELYHERLWGPLGLMEIFLPGLEEPVGPVAKAWTGPPSNQQELNPLDMMSLLTIGNSGFGIFSNARTVARWGRALFTGQVFGDEMRAEMLDFVPAAGNIRGESGAGLGIRKYSYLGREQWGHSGGSPLGSSLLLYDPDTGVTVAVIMNQGGGAQHFVLAPRLLEIATRD